ncbi:universal stress protein [Mucilaginibacter lacusdianchii]|uniref:universal stress protein n=1 Tax=Mucilaginibacter lacusdianchii TaxID=2684211 RepID=UPI00131AFDE5|nr:universal stress protein [Mucilaginibacter sp. JXJ CY 39]
MKKLLVATDFSTPAENAARYAWHLAKGIKANVELFNAFKIPADATMAAQVAWPMPDFQSLEEETMAELKLLADKLAAKDEYTATPGAFIPAINCANEVGGLADVISDEVTREKVCLVVMGMSGAGALSRFFLGSNSHDLINQAIFPLLLIPACARFKGIKKIALATDLHDTDIAVINSLATLAQHYHAEILLSHITDDKFEEPDQDRVRAFLKEVTCKVNYSKIYYRHIKSQNVEQGLEWLTEHGHVDMLAMVHRKHNWLERVLDESYTQRIARRIDIPLMVFPDTGNRHSYTAF